MPPPICIWKTLLLGIPLGSSTRKGPKEGSQCVSPWALPEGLLPHTQSGWSLLTKDPLVDGSRLNVAQKANVSEVDPERLTLSQVPASQRPCLLLPQLWR